ncbi:WEB family protein At2g17940 [Argentina anserina]|uniref:WEB family protein At2g17940 n=1 Tax=Argentina anserina TaxID=57926 RepID=UPI002176394B|nr:WEB family protein At2g17940 [Potentilla anserina]
METQNLQVVPVQHDYRANVDTSRAFSSVKEAVAVFGERLLLGEFFSPSPSPKPPQLLPPYTKEETEIISSRNKFVTSPSTSADPQSDESDHVLDSLKKLEAELEQTKVELKLLKERESETEVALATLNAELHKNMSKLAQAEAAAAAKAADSSNHHVISSMRTNSEEAERNVKMDQWSMIRMEDSTSLAQMLSIGAQHEKQYGYGSGGKRERNNKMMKKKPIVPLLQDLFSWKKGSSTPLHDHLYSSPKLYY